jgi:hypothetical protein
VILSEFHSWFVQPPRHPAISLRGFEPWSMNFRSLWNQLRPAVTNTSLFLLQTAEICVWACRIHRDFLDLHCSMGFLHSTTDSYLDFRGFIKIEPLYLLLFIPFMIPKHLSKTKLFNLHLPVGDPPAMYSPWSLLLLSYMLQFTWGWGDLGHRTVAYLVEGCLSEQGAQLVEDLCPEWYFRYFRRSSLGW